MVKMGKLDPENMSSIVSFSLKKNKMIVFNFLFVKTPEDVHDNGHV